MAKTKTIAGGSATGGGINFQAAVTGVVSAHIAVGAKLDWLVGIVNDTPIRVSAETGGPGDDIAITFSDGTVAEVQAKKGFTAGKKLWEVVVSLAKAIASGTIQYGVLAVCPHSSGTIRNDFARDLERLSSGRRDGLKDVTETFIQKMEAESLSAEEVSKRLRVATMNCLVSDGDTIKAAKALLGHICTSATEADHAWDVIYIDATRLIEYRKASAADSIVKALRSSGVALRDNDRAPSIVFDALCAWTVKANHSFSIPGLPQALPFAQAWISLDARIVAEPDPGPAGLAEALNKYHAEVSGERPRDQDFVRAETIGRFSRLAVVLGGPGMGKSTLLRKLAHLYASEGFPVLRFNAKALADRIRITACTFEEGILALGTGGVGLPITKEILQSGAQWVLLCDALDEAGADQEIVCSGLLGFSAGYPTARIIASSRPIGYESNALREWRHYELRPFSSNDIDSHINRLIVAVISDPDQQATSLAFAKAQIEKNSNATIAARNPLLLGLISALAVQHVAFGATRTQLYDRLFHQMEKANSKSSVQPELTATVLTTFLDMLAWELLQDPVASATALHDRCGKHLAQALRDSQLNARMLAEKCLKWWEAVGMIERVNHAGIDAITFIHKTFGEYAAARYLSEMSAEEARTHIDLHIHDKAWTEVLIFASSLGLIDATLKAYIGNKTLPDYDTTIRALSMIDNSERDASAPIRQSIFEAAAIYLASPLKGEAYSTGIALLSLTARFPKDVASACKGLTESEQLWTRLVAFAAMTLGDSPPFNVVFFDRLIAELPTLDAAVNLAERMPMYNSLAELDASPTGLIDGLYVFAVREGLAHLPPHESEAKLAPLLTEEHPGSIGGYMQLNSLVEMSGRQNLSTLLERSMKPLINFNKDLFPPGYGGGPGLITALKHVLPDTTEIKVLPEGSRLWQISAFLSAMKFRKQPVSGIWSPRFSPDDPGLQEVLRGVVSASGADPATMAAEVDLLFARHSTSPQTPLAFLIHDHTEHVDVQVDYKRAQGLNLTRLESSLHCPLHWVSEFAAELILAHASARQLADIVRRVIKSGKDVALLSASWLCLHFDEPQKTEILLEGLDRPSRRGSQHLLRALAETEIVFDERLFRILRSALLGADPQTASVAAEIAHRQVAVNSEVENLLQESFDLWISQEDPYPVYGGVVPPSPREDILRALAQGSNFDARLLLQYVLDDRRDIAMLASTYLMQVLKQGFLLDEFVAAIRASNIPYELLSQALDQDTPFAQTQIDAICTFLSAPDASLRLAALSVLRPAYLPQVALREYITSLLDDSDPQLREQARRLLAEQPGEQTGL